MRRLLTAFATIVGLGLAVTPAFAFDDGRPTSVFPQPRDPWKSWGVQRTVPHNYGAPHVVHGGVVIATPAPAPVWVPGRWWWDGWAWQWAPGYWSY